MRLFVGLALPPAVLDDLDATCAPFRPLRDDLRWTSREAWHITLAFLGEVTDLSLARLLPRLERAARRHSSFSLGLEGAGAFPSPARANVLWIGLAGDRAPADVRPIVASLEPYQGPPWTAEEIYLIRSRPGGQPRYETLGSWKLRTG